MNEKLKQELRLQEAQDFLDKLEMRKQMSIEEQEILQAKDPVQAALAYIEREGLEEKYIDSCLEESFIEKMRKLTNN